MSRFFGRLACVAVGPSVPLLNSPSPTQIQDAPALFISSPLRIQFKIEKQPYTPPNQADISITNLSDETRGKMQKFGAVVQLRAGYKSDAPLSIEQLPVLFHGDARTIDHVRKGTEWITRIQCGDGETAYRYAQVNISRPPGTPLAEIAKEMAQQLTSSGIDISGFLGQLGSGKLTFRRTQQMVAGFATQGNALQELEKILAPEGWAVSVQNGRLQVVDAFGVNPKVVQLISPETGLLGSPEFGSPDKNGRASILKVQSLLLPNMLPADWFQVDSSDFKTQNFRAEKVVHTGDTHGGDWKTEIEARPLVPSQ